MISNFRQKLYCADSLRAEKHSFLQQHYKQMKSEPLQSDPSDCGFYTMYAIFHLFILRQEGITGVDVLNVLSSKIM